jgi:hypothetical protein
MIVLRRMTVVLLICFTSVLTKAQEPIDFDYNKHTFYVEIGGPSGTITSVNYDKIIYCNKKLLASISLGFGYFPSVNNQSHQFGAPITVNASFGKNKHFFEIGTGLTYGLFESGEYVIQDFSGIEINYTEPIESWLWTFRIGYKYQKSDGGLFIRASFTPLIPIQTSLSTSHNNAIIPGIGFGIGYTL